MTRPAAVRWSVRRVAAAWRVSERALRDAAAILGYQPIGDYLYASPEELDPARPFYKEASYVHESLNRRKPPT